MTKKVKSILSITLALIFIVSAFAVPVNFNAAVVLQKPIVIPTVPDCTIPPPPIERNELIVDTKRTIEAANAKELNADYFERKLVETVEASDITDTEATLTGRIIYAIREILVAKRKISVINPFIVELGFEYGTIQTVIAGKNVYSKIGELKNIDSISGIQFNDEAEYLDVTVDELKNVKKDIIDESVIPFLKRGTIFNARVAGLTPNTTYWFKAYAKNGFGTKYYGGEKTFKTKAIYTVKYDANGGIGAPSGQIKIEDNPLTLSTQIPIKIRQILLGCTCIRRIDSRYEFAGWSTDKNAKTAMYQPGDVYTDNVSVTLYAVWMENKKFSFPPPQQSEDIEALKVYLADNFPEYSEDTAAQLVEWDGFLETFRNKYSNIETSEESVILFEEWEVEENTEEQLVELDGLLKAFPNNDKISMLAELIQEPETLDTEKSGFIRHKALEAEFLESVSQNVFQNKYADVEPEELGTLQDIVTFLYPTAVVENDTVKFNIGQGYGNHIIESFPFPNSMIDDEYISGLLPNLKDYAISLEDAVRKYKITSAHNQLPANQSSRGSGPLQSGVITSIWAIISIFF